MLNQYWTIQLGENGHIDGTLQDAHAFTSGSGSFADAQQDLGVGFIQVLLPQFMNVVMTLLGGAIDSSQVQLTVSGWSMNRAIRFQIDISASSGITVYDYGGRQEPGDGGTLPNGPGSGAATPLTAAAMAMLLFCLAAMVKIRAGLLPISFSVCAKVHISYTVLS
jgi:hypothetical protein